MLIEEEKSESTGEINPDALEAVFEEDVLIEEDVLPFNKAEDEEADEIDIAFQADDSQDW